MILRVLCILALVPLLIGVFLSRRYTHAPSLLRGKVAPLKTWEICQEFLPASITLEVGGSKVVLKSNHIRIPIDSVESRDLTSQLDLLTMLALYRIGEENSDWVRTHETLRHLQVLIPLFALLILILGACARTLPSQFLPLIFLSMLGASSLCSLYLSYIRWQAATLVIRWIGSRYTALPYKEDLIAYLHFNALRYSIPLSRK